MSPKKNESSEEHLSEKRSRRKKLKRQEENEDENLEKTESATNQKTEEKRSFPLFMIKIFNGRAFKIEFDYFSHAHDSCEFCINKDGFKVISFSSSKGQLDELTCLQKDIDIFEFSSKRPVNFQLETKLIHGVLKSIRKEDQVTVFMMSNDPKKLLILLGDKNRRKGIRVSTSDGTKFNTSGFRLDESKPNCIEYCSQVKTVFKSIKESKATSIDIESSNTGFIFPSTQTVENHEKKKKSKVQLSLVYSHDGLGSFDNESSQNYKNVPVKIDTFRHMSKLCSLNPDGAVKICKDADEDENEVRGPLKFVFRASTFGVHRVFLGLDSLNE